MDEETISEHEKYMVSFNTRFIIDAKNYDEVLEKIKTEIIKKLDTPDSADTDISIHIVTSSDDEDHQLSYVDDWEFDDRW
ncbi:MAG: hypothetical protein ACW99A_12370 [Candidatus Kariarchaeaceae archaeon]|jgi:hypothetical protein